MNLALMTVVRRIFEGVCSWLPAPAARDWRSPGFHQSESEPVVCISLQDAEAYAAWSSKQTGQHWRLQEEALARHG